MRDVNRRYDLEDIEDDDPAYEMLGSKYAKLVDREPDGPVPRHRDDGELRGRGHDERRHRRPRSRPGHDD